MCLEKVKHTVDSCVAGLSVGIENSINMRQSLALVLIVVEKLCLYAVFSECLFSLERLSQSKRVAC